MIDDRHGQFIAQDTGREELKVAVKYHQQNQGKKKRRQRPPDNGKYACAVIDPAVPVDTGDGPQPYPQENDNGGGVQIHLQGDGKIAPEGFPHGARRHQGPTQVPPADLLDPAHVLDVNGLVETELLDDAGDVLGLLGRGDIGGRPALGAESHQDAEQQHRHAEEHKGQKEKPPENIGVHRLPGKGGESPGIKP